MGETAMNGRHVDEDVEMHERIARIETRLSASEKMAADVSSDVKALVAEMHSLTGTVKGAAVVVGVVWAVVTFVLRLHL